MTQNNWLSGSRRFFCSWSGGKDSCLSLYRELKRGHECVSLFTMTDEDGELSRSHGLTPDALRIQAESLGIPLCKAGASWDLYEDEFKKQLSRYRDEQVYHGVFGDIDLEPHRDWVTRVCGEAGISPLLPLWKKNRAALVREFIDAGFRAVIVVVNCSMMPSEFLGREIDPDLIGELERIGVDPCGENGEYHTFVYDGPLFRKKINLIRGESFSKEKYCFLPLRVSF